VGRFLAALQFLTVIPLPGRGKVHTAELARSAGYFPLIGLIIGLILAGLNWLFGLFLPDALADALLLVAMVLLTGALHLDGFVDTCDGLAGHHTAEERWHIMDDSRAGGFGVVGAVLLLLVKYLSLNSLPDHLMLMTLVLMPVLGRWAMVYAVFTHSYAKPSGLGKELKEGTSWPRFTLATVVAVGVVAVLAQVVGVALMFLVWLATVALAAYFRAKFAGLTGDTYGAINELIEVGVLILINIFALFGIL
jgi:adenosylcobinamide-GDP ribazoletransferase